MKKSKLSIGLVTSFIGALALTSCNSTTAKVTKSKTSVVDIDGYDSEEISVNIDEIYKEYGESSNGTKLFYNAVLETLIRYEYPLIAEKDSELKSYSKVQSEANDKISALQQTARDNAKANDTEYDEEWDKILESNDVKTTKDLKLKFIYELEKEAMGDWYFKKNVESTDTVKGLREQYLGVDANWNQVTTTTENVDSLFPYHILQILVKLDGADATNYNRATITEAQAKKLWAVMRQLVDAQYTFEETVKLTDDDGSKDAFGDDGIMTTKTSFVNEFKLGVYAYDAILSGLNTENDNNNKIYKAFGVDESSEVVTKSVSSVDQTGNLVVNETKEKVKDLILSEMVDNVNVHREVANSGIVAVPFDVFRQIGLHAEDTKIGTFEPEGSSANLPRNVLFNAFLNFRAPFVITSELLDETSVSLGDDDVATTEYHFDDPDILKLAENNFEAIEIGGTPKKVLCDTNGNVIIGVRSTYGIHFMVMRKSVFKATNERVGKVSTSLMDYYTTKVPGEEGFPEGKETFVNMKVTSDPSYYTGRSDTIKNEIKSTNFDAAYEYRLYEALLDYKFDGTKMSDKLHFFDEDESGESVIRNNINDMISLLRENAHNSQIDSINKAWKDYLLQLINQNNMRSDEGMYEGAFVPTTCAFSFSKGNEDLYKEGGACYVK